MLGLLLTIDFEKAFDSLDWGFMFKVLRLFCFQDDICNWIGTFYSSMKSTFIVYEQTSQWFSVNRGCRQGNPLSPYLFILCVEILGIMIREKETIKDVFANSIEHKLSQYADDTEFILAGDRKTFETCISILDSLGKISGLFMTAEKTSAIWQGNKKNSNTRHM